MSQNPPLIFDYYHISNPVVYRKEFDNLYQSQDINCNFTCPYNQDHDFADYHIINTNRCSIFDKSLKHKLLQKSSYLKTLPEISQSTVKDKNKLSNKNPLFSFKAVDTEELLKDEVIAAISNYKQRISNHTNKKSPSKYNYCGYTQHSQKQTPLHKVKHAIYIYVKKFVTQNKNFYDH